MLDTLVDNLIRPETIMRAMQERKLRAKSVADTTPVEPVADQQAREWRYERLGADKLVAYAVDPNKPEQGKEQQFGLVLERSGFATWRLTGLQLPATK